MNRRAAAGSLGVAAIMTLLPSFAADIVMTPPAAGGVSVTNAAGNTMRFRVGEDGLITLPGMTAAPGPTTGLCMEIATGRIGTCTLASGTVTGITAGSGLTGGTISTSGTISLAATNLLPTVACSTSQVPQWSGSAWVCATIPGGGGTVTSVGANAPLSSSGGTTPVISLTGAIPVANGGTGATTLATNGIVYGQGTGALATAVGAAGQVLAGSAGAPTWTGSPSLSGNLGLAASSNSTAGNIFKNGARFLHTFGTSNTFVGQNAGNFSVSGAFITAVGSPGTELEFAL